MVTPMGDYRVKTKKHGNTVEFAIPKEIRDLFGIKAGDILLLHTSRVGFSVRRKV